MTIKPTREDARKAKAVGQAHTAKEYALHDHIMRKGLSSVEAWKATMSLPPKKRGRRPG